MQEASKQENNYLQKQTQTQKESKTMRVKKKSPCASDLAPCVKKKKRKRQTDASGACAASRTRLSPVLLTHKVLRDLHPAIRSLFPPALTLFQPRQPPRGCWRLQILAQRRAFALSV